MSLLDEFINYLKDQVGQPYVWGGQHTKLTPENYVSVIRRKEKSTNKQNWEDDANAAIAFCKKKFNEGAEVLYAYDCSGLGCYWLYNLRHLYKSDVNANTMMTRCELREDGPKKGWWVFRLSGSKASHIGYMIDDEYLIEAKGRKFGVVKTKFRTKDWDCWGIPNVFADELKDQDEPVEPVESDIPSEPVDPPTPIQQYVVIKGRVVNGKPQKSVNIREGNGVYKNCETGEKNKILGTAHSTDKFPYLGTADEAPYWYKIEYKGKPAYVTCQEKYTGVT